MSLTIFTVGDFPRRSVHRLSAVSGLTPKPCHLMKRWDEILERDVLDRGMALQPPLDLVEYTRILVEGQSDSSDRGSDHALWERFDDFECLFWNGGI